MAAQCESNWDCDVNELCYTGVSWLNSTEELTTANGCLCNSFYGWIGDDCSKGSLSTSITIGWIFIIILMSIISFCMVILSIIRTYRSGKLFRLSALTATLALTAGSVIGTAIWASVVLLSAIDRTGPFLLDGYEDQYKGRYNIVSVGGAPAALALGAIALLHISFMWVEVAYATGRMSGSSATNLNRTKRLIYGSEVMMVILGMAGWAIERMTGRSVMGFTLSPIIFFVLLSYIYGAHVLNSLLLVSIQKETEMTGRGSIAAYPQRERGATKDDFESSQLSKSDQPSVSESAEMPAERKPSFFVQSTQKLSSSRFSVKMPGSNSSKASKKKKKSKKVSRSVFRKVLKKVRNTAIAMSCALIIIWSATLGISVNDQLAEAGWKEFQKPGDPFGKVKFFHHLQIFSIALISLICAVYVQVDPAASTGSSNGRSRAGTITERLCSCLCGHTESANRRQTEDPENGAYSSSAAMAPGMLSVAQPVQSTGEI